MDFGLLGFYFVGQIQQGLAVDPERKPTSTTLNATLPKGRGVRRTEFLQGKQARSQSGRKGNGFGRAPKVKTAAALDQQTAGNPEQQRFGPDGAEIKKMLFQFVPVFSCN